MTITKAQKKACLDALAAIKDAKLVYSWEAQWLSVKTGKTPKKGEIILCSRRTTDPTLYQVGLTLAENKPPLVSADFTNKDPAAKDVVNALTEEVELASKEPLTNAEKKSCNKALDMLEKKKSLDFAWDVSWTALHGGGTSELDGLKPCSRKDSWAASKPYHIGLAVGEKRKLKLPPVVETTFEQETSNTADIVAALRDAVAKG